MLHISSNLHVSLNAPGSPHKTRSARSRLASKLFDVADRGVSIVFGVSPEGLNEEIIEPVRANDSEHVDSEMPINRSLSRKRSSAEIRAALEGGLSGDSAVGEQAAQATLVQNSTKTIEVLVELRESMDRLCGIMSRLHADQAEGPGSATAVNAVVNDEFISSSGPSTEMVDDIISQAFGHLREKREKGDGDPNRVIVSTSET